MLFFKIDVDVFLSASKESNNIVSVSSFFFPGVYVMEDHMTRSLKPLHLIWIRTISFHDSVSWWLGFVKTEDEFVFFHSQIGSQFHWRVRDDPVIFSHYEIVDHTRASDWNYAALNKLSILIEKRIGYNATSGLVVDAVSKAKELASFSIHLWMGGDVVGQLSSKIIKSDTLYVKTFLVSINLDIKWEVWFISAVSLFLMMSKWCVSSTVSKFLNISTMFVPNFFFKIKESTLHKSRYVKEFTGSNENWSTLLNFCSESWSLEISITIKDFTILNSKSVNHGVSVKKVSSSIVRMVLSVWTVSQINTVDVCRDFTFRYLEYLVEFFFLSTQKISFEHWVCSGVNFQL